jgi:hypothetical protein
LLIENSTKHEKMSVASSHLFMDRIGLAVPKRLQLFGVSKFLYSGRTQNSGAALSTGSGSGVVTSRPAAMICPVVKAVYRSF